MSAKDKDLVPKDAKRGEKTTSLSKATQDKGRRDSTPKVKAERKDSPSSTGKAKSISATKTSDIRNKSATDDESSALKTPSKKKGSIKKDTDEKTHVGTHNTLNNLSINHESSQGVDKSTPKQESSEKGVRNITPSIIKSVQSTDDTLKRKSINLKASQGVDISTPMPKSSEGGVNSITPGIGAS